MMFGIMLLLNVMAAESNSTMHVSANILEGSVGISVPDSISFGNIAAGYLSNKTDVIINNTGTTNIRITPQISDSTSTNSSEIFANIAFRNILNDPLMKIGNYSLDILKPVIVGNTRSENIYVYLDLTEYNGDVVSLQEADIVFWATEI